MEASREEDEDFQVAKISAKEWRKGLPYYRVHWEGFDEEEATWELALSATH